ncbi:MAG: hypothetical protein IPI67_31650 [Myxococcales bacterium]|nr:hypothetical protein [Myxococcales bacterium]
MNVRRARIHAIAHAAEGNLVPLTDKPDQTLPFVFCKATTLPPELKDNAHVVAEGKVEDNAMLEECSLTLL